MSPHRPLVASRRGRRAAARGARHEIRATLAALPHIARNGDARDKLDNGDAGIEAPVSDRVLAERWLAVLRAADGTLPGMRPGEFSQPSAEQCQEPDQPARARTKEEHIHS